MDLKKKILELELEYDLGLRPKEYKQAVASLEKRQASLESDEEWLAAIGSITRRMRSNPLRKDIKKQVTASVKVCPLCGNSGEPISLMRNRKAYFCKAHNVVLPDIVE